MSPSGRARRGKMVYSQKLPPSVHMALSSPPSLPSSFQRLGRRTSDVVVALPCEFPSVVSTNSPIFANQTVKGSVDNDEAKGYVCRACKKKFLNSQGFGAHQNIHNKERAERKALARTTSNISLRPRHRSPLGIAFRSCKASPTIHSSPTNISRNFGSSGAAQFNPHDFSAPVDGIVQAEGVSMSYIETMALLNQQRRRLHGLVGTSTANSAPLEFDLNEPPASSASTSEEGPAGLDLDLNL